MLKGNLRLTELLTQVPRENSMVSRIFRYGNLVRRSGPKWAKARQPAKRASEPIKGSTKAWESSQLVDYELDGTHCRFIGTGVEHATLPVRIHPTVTCYEYMLRIHTRHKWSRTFLESNFELAEKYYFVSRAGRANTINLKRWCGYGQLSKKTLRCVPTLWFLFLGPK